MDGRMGESKSCLNRVVYRGDRAEYYYVYITVQPAHAFARAFFFSPLSTSRPASAGACAPAAGAAASARGSERSYAICEGLTAGRSGCGTILACAVRRKGSEP